MNVAQRIQLIRIIEKIEKNPEFSNKLGVKNTSDFISDKQRKNESLTIGLMYIAFPLLIIGGIIGFVTSHS